MKALYHGSIQRMAITGNAVTASTATNARVTHRAIRRPNFFFTLLAGSLGDDDVGRRHVLMARTRGRGDRGDLVDDVHAGGDLAEHGIAVVRRARVVEETVVDEIDEELRRGAVDDIRA